jgi:hypothetical protein
MNGRMSAFGGKANATRHHVSTAPCPLMTQSGHCAGPTEQLHNVRPSPFQSAGLSRYDVAS